MRLERRLASVLIHLSYDEAKELAVDGDFSGLQSKLADEFVCDDCGDLVDDSGTCVNILCPECPLFEDDDDGEPELLPDDKDDPA